MNKMVDIVESSMIPVDLILVLEASYRDTSMMKFYGMVILCLAKKFEQYESEFAKVREECAKAN